MLHFLKLDEKYFDAVDADIKRAELRINDRNYSVGDVLVLMECFEGKYTGRLVIRQVTYILRCSMLALDQWVILSIRPINGVVDCFEYDVTKLPTR